MHISFSPHSSDEMAFPLCSWGNRLMKAQRGCGYGPLTVTFIGRFCKLTLFSHTLPDRKRIPFLPYCSVNLWRSLWQMIRYKFYFPRTLPSHSRLSSPIPLPFGHSCFSGRLAGSDTSFWFPKSYDSAGPEIMNSLMPRNLFCSFPSVSLNT